VARGAIRMVFWAFVLAGVFVLGLGYGRTLSGEDELRSDEVTVTVARDAVTATLPTTTVTVTRTVMVRAPRAGQRARPAGGN
jgi:alpha-D-ribose 1-methylphosphonate 5-triphosphate synthase subunit PhnI